MQGGGPGSNRGGSSVRRRFDAIEKKDGIGSAIHTARLNGWTADFVAATIAREEPSVLQQSVELPCVAHVSSPSLQHAICAFVVEPSTHADHNDQPKLAARTKAVTRAARESIRSILVQDFFLRAFAAGSNLAR